MSHLRTYQRPNARVTTTLTKHILQTLLLAGYSRQSPSYRPLAASLKTGGVSSSNEAFSNNNNSRLGPIERHLWAIKQAIGEGVTSCDILPCAYPGAQPFDGAIMEDMYPDEEPGQLKRKRNQRSGDTTPSPSDEKAKGLPILGTVQLGVQKTTSVRSGREKDGGRMIRQKEILVRPKVILARTLEEPEEASR